MRGFGDLELAVMEYLWATGESCTVGDVLVWLRPEHVLAYTTVSTVMDRLCRKGHLARTRSGRAYRYVAVAGRDEHVACMMRQTLDDSADTARALFHFVGRLTLDDAAALRAALRLIDQTAPDGDPAPTT